DHAAYRADDVVVAERSGEHFAGFDAVLHRHHEAAIADEPREPRSEVSALPGLPRDEDDVSGPEGLRVVGYEGDWDGVVSVGAMDAQAVFADRGERRAARQHAHVVAG